MDNYDPILAKHGIFLPLTETLQTITQERLKLSSLKDGIERKKPQPKPAPNCAWCNDLGWYLLGPEQRLTRCKCKEAEDSERRREVNWNICNLPEQLRTASLQAFGVKEPGNKLARNAVRDYLNGKLGTPWLYLEGGFETGKTYLAACVVRGSIEQGKYALYHYVPKMLQGLKNAMNGGNYGQAYEQLEQPDVLLLDDMATEEWTPWAIETLTIMFEHYYEAHKPLVVTSNLALSKWPDNVGRIRRRLEDPDMCTIVVNNAPRFKARKG